MALDDRCEIPIIVWRMIYAILSVWLSESMYEARSTVGSFVTWGRNKRERGNVRTIPIEVRLLFDRMV